DQGRVVESGTHGELMARPGVYRALMAPQVGAGGEGLADALAMPGVAAAGSAVQPEVRRLSEDAAEIGWGETLRALLGFVRPWRLRLILTILSGVGRVVAFIGVS